MTTTPTKTRIYAHSCPSNSSGIVTFNGQLEASHSFRRFDSEAEYQAAMAKLPKGESLVMVDYKTVFQYIPFPVWDKEGYVVSAITIIENYIRRDEIAEDSLKSYDNVMNAYEETINA